MEKSTDRLKKLFHHPFFHSKYTLLTLWIIIGVASAVTKFISNNYLIYKYSFLHLIEKECLYGPHPLEYRDLHHYGPIFSVIMCPFALLPDMAGMLLWDVSLAAFLYWAIRQSGFKWGTQLFLLWFCSHELLTAIMMQQINVAIAGMILLTYCFIQKGKEHWAAFFMTLAIFIKLFGIVGFAFLPFCKNKKKLLLWIAIWSVVMFCLPMAFSSPEYIIDMYKEWWIAISDKNHQSLLSSHQNISLLGMIRKIGYCLSLGSHSAYMDFFNGDPLAHITDRSFWFTYSDKWIILCGIIAFALPYLRIRQWQNEPFARTFLASTLMFLCLFSTSTESSGYIIGIIGPVIWYTAAPWQRNRLDIALMVLVFILTSMSPSDLFPRYLRTQWVQPFALKALPIALCWIKLTVEMLTKDYTPQTEITK